VSAGPSLYRRHRPRTFADVVGQEHVVRTLSHAVQRDQIHHAYLFVGSRGTGKTSMAKILAACLNCENGPTITPCGVCDSCVSIASATSLDVIEMDAASNNSVDDIRDLREKVGYAPVSGRHKVYILDEAHMLSTQAWNAFLKTLEEPPPRTVFVLATTEAQKVLPTVVDRCHRFDFGRPTAEQVATVVRRVATTEAIRIEEGAAALIARHATGSFRDALGTLEQLVTYAGDDQITSGDVLAVLGVADGEQLFAAVDAIIAADPAAALRCAAALAGTGRDSGQILRDLEVHGRELLTVQILGEVPAELRVTAERDERLRRQSQTLSQTDAVRLIDLISSALQASNNGAQSRIQLELALVRAAAPEMDPSVSALLARIERLERGGVRASAASVAPATGTDHSSTAAQKDAQIAVATDAAASAPEATPAVKLAEPSAQIALTVAELQRTWPAVVELVRGGNAMLAVVLESARPATVTDRELVLSFPAAAAFNKRKAEQDDNRRTTAEAVRNVTGATLTLRYELAEPEAPADPDADPDSDSDSDSDSDRQGATQPKPLSDDELVEKFKAEFGAEEILQDDHEMES
jgi:DNA polymerase-3 subunit gamma/tau